MMKDAAKATRPSKREVIVIDDEDSTNEQPVEKKGKGDAEAVLSAKVDELQKELDKWKDKYQRAVRYAGEYRERAEKAEERLDSKYGIKEVFNAEKIRANELEKRLAEVSSELDEARRRADSTANLDLMRENETLRKEMVEERTAFHDRIAEMSKKLAVYEEAEEREREKEAAKQKPEVAPEAHDESSQKVAELHETGHPTNIFQLCSPDSSESTSFKIAREKIFSLTEKLEGPTIGMKVQQHFRKLPTWNIMEHMEACCVACGMTLFTGHAIMEHFHGKRHQKKFSALGAAVSSAALEYWMAQLKVWTKTVAASPKVDGARKET